MKEILFRGISKDSKKWVYGAHVKRLSISRSIIVDNPIGECRVEVYPDTVGEYTGFDIQGAKVFEGDVLTDDNGINWVVEFRYGFFGVVCLKTNEFCSLNAFTEIYQNAKHVSTIHDHYFDLPYEDKKLLNEELVILNETVAQIEKVISKHVNIDELAESLRKLNDEIKRVSKEVQI